MHTGSHYKLNEFIFWTSDIILKLLVLAVVPTVLYIFFDLEWIALPWVPVALIGTAAAFIIGFKNTQTYNRLWEARQIWGGVVNSSRAWGIMVKDFVRIGDNAEQENLHRMLIYRHIAWLTAFRYQLREKRTWENTDKPYNRRYHNYYDTAEWDGRLEEELKRFLPEGELANLLTKKNRATQIIALQSKHLADLKERGYIDPLAYIEMENVLVAFYDHQGKAERIKNFPYPRQFATINLFFIRLFVIMVPFGLLNEFQKIGENYVWLNIPFSLLVGWVFASMERVGESTENPFEGGANDVPITALSRTIEIDLRDMLNESDLPPAIQPRNSILT
ncbi:MAG: bestrophin family protein [Flavobacteriales bacterium]